MDAKFQVCWKPILLDRVSDHGEVVVEFALELREVADIIHAFVEAAREFRGDGLDTHVFVGKRGEDNEEFRWRLRGIGFVHRNLGDEVGLSLLG